MHMYFRQYLKVSRKHFYISSIKQYFIVARISVLFHFLYSFKLRSPLNFISERRKFFFCSIGKSRIRISCLCLCDKILFLVYFFYDSIFNKWMEIKILAIPKEMIDEFFRTHFVDFLPRLRYLTNEAVTFLSQKRDCY